MLLDQYREVPDSFSVLSKPDVLRLKKMQDDFKSGQYSLFSGTLDFSSEIPDEIKKEKSGKKHKDVCYQILKKKEELERYTGSIDFANFEHPVIFGHIDLLVQSGKRAFIIEVKTETADHSIIGQVMKYYIGLSLKLNLKFFDEIETITLCPSYDKPSYNGLKQINAIPLTYKFKPFRIRQL